MSVNKVILIGNLGKDPEVRHLDNGRARTTFSLATSESYKNREGQRVSQTEWHNIVLWSPLAEIAEKYLKKGNKVYIEGRITTRSYDDRDGNKRYITEIVTQSMTMLGGRSESNGYDDNGYNQNQGTQQQQASTAQNQPLEEQTDDLPF